MNSTLMRQTAALLSDLLKFESPADAKLGEFFRQHRELGTKERAWVAETSYGVLRRYRYLSEISTTETD
jgi:16S rRNA (cytosine967-C5)-methyltransferase